MDDKVLFSIIDSEGRLLELASGIPDFFPQYYILDTNNNNITSIRLFTSSSYHLPTFKFSCVKLDLFLEVMQ